MTPAALREHAEAGRIELAARLREALGTADDERVRQEIALYGIKVDVNAASSLVGEQ